MAKLVPLPTQDADADYLASNSRGALFSEAGTGKTLTVLEGFSRQSSANRLLVTAPPIALRMWEQNISDHLGCKVQRIASGKDQIDFSADAIVMSYSMVAPMIAQDPTLGVETAIAIDESDALKTLSSQRTKAVYGTRASGRNCLIDGAEFVWPMTGTPIRRYADDLYPHLRSLHPALLKSALGITSLTGFQRDFCVTQLKRFHPRQPAKPTVIGNKNEQALHGFIYNNDLAVRRTIHDVARYMPPLTINEVTVDYNESQELLEACAGSIEMTEDDAVMATARRLLGEAKAPYVANYALDVKSGVSCPILLLYWHKDVGQVLRSVLSRAGQRVDLIDGATSSDDRFASEQRFNAGDTDFLLGQISSMGVAINLQAGSHYAIFAEEDWSPAAKEQAMRRIWRLGQDTHVHVDVCLADHDLDQAVSNVIDRKDVSARRIINL